MPFNVLRWWLQFGLYLALAVWLAEIDASMAALCWGFAAGTNFVIALIETFEAA